MSVQQESEFAKAIEVDQHGIEPIPDADRDSTSWQQFWIWFGANVSPTSWVVGTLGPLLGLSLVQSIGVFAVGQAAGALIFGAFTIMGRRTGVNQLTMGRSAFGVGGNRGVAIIQGLITLSWIGLNTYVVLTLATYTLHKLGAPQNTTTEYAVAAFIMVVQVLIGTAAWGAVVLVDFFLTRRGQISVAELYKPGTRSEYGAVSYRGLISFIAGLVAGWAWEYGLVPAFQGPIARATHDIDLSWLAAAVVGGGLYYLLARANRGSVAAGSPAPGGSSVEEVAS
jgi:purine-cytosine permease-like protein